jgi:hypothetical protein
LRSTTCTVRRRRRCAVKAAAITATSRLLLLLLHLFLSQILSPKLNLLASFLLLLCFSRGSLPTPPAAALPPLLQDDLLCSFWSRQPCAPWPLMLRGVFDCRER